MADTTTYGRFVWYELMTPNRAGAETFYSSVLGWGLTPWEHDPDYRMFAAARGPLGGSTETHDGPPVWIAYVNVADVDATLRRAAALGGSIVREPVTMPNGGRHAVLADPHGVAIGVYSSAADVGPETTPGPGEFSWHELATSDHADAFEFYAELFGWDKVGEHDMGPMGMYLLFGHDGRQVGGMFDKGDTGQPGPGYWLHYVRVADLEDAVRRVTAGRGTLLHGPMEVPGGDRIAQVMDPHGALFALHATAADVAVSAEGGAAARASTAKVARTKPKGTSASTARPGAAEATAGKTAARDVSATKPKATKPKAAKPKAAKSKPSKSKAAQSKAAKARTATSKPKAATSKSPKAKAVKSKAAKSKAVKSKAAKSKSTKSKAAKSKAVKSKPAKSRAAKSKSAGTKQTKSKTPKSKAPTSKAAKSKASKAAKSKAAKSKRRVAQKIAKAKGKAAESRQKVAKTRSTKTKRKTNTAPRASVARPAARKRKSGARKH